MQSFLYDGATYEPSAPVVPITVTATGKTTGGVQIQALIDTGADATILPIAVIRQIGAKYAESRRWRAIGGKSGHIVLYRVTIEIAGHTIEGIRAIGAPFDTEPILGRDVLNQLIITLDGFAETTEIAS